MKQTVFVSLLLVSFLSTVPSSLGKIRQFRRVSQIHFENPTFGDPTKNDVRNIGYVGAQFKTVDKKVTKRNLSLWSSFLHMLHCTPGFKHHNNCEHSGHGGGSRGSETNGMHPSPGPSPSWNFGAQTQMPTTYEDNVSNDMHCWWCRRSERVSLFNARNAAIGTFLLGSVILLFGTIKKKQRCNVSADEHLLQGSVKKRKLFFMKVFSCNEKNSSTKTNEKLQKTNESRVNELIQV